MLEVSLLLGELLVAVVEAGPTCAANTPQARMMGVILDQIVAQRIAALAVPMPSDHRLQRITDAPIFSPSDGRNLTDWPGSLGSNKRTLTQLFSTQAGMSFRASHQQWRLHRSVELLAARQSITVISREVGYESPSAIIAMFQRYLATTPSRFLAK